MCASFGSTRLICASFGSTRLICAFYGTTRLLCRVRAQRGADRREAGRTREGHMDVSDFLFASADPYEIQHHVCHAAPDHEHVINLLDEHLEEGQQASQGSSWREDGVFFCLLVLSKLLCCPRISTPDSHLT
ncbi:hypothetical protein E5676_scaffold142G002860 [Cucumis melo var. makuwa]|uniref:Uncharacterized protein n=1 Tax=Cucumis melo var. makuwa TaxID=1194695 RepID=A0A5D3DHV2_CUCMM|nr:hypothetical protein E5676_scaffold142G002860 [Cucumis melo var. makuwa]